MDNKGYSLEEGEEEADKKKKRNYPDAVNIVNSGGEDEIQVGEMQDSRREGDDDPAYFASLGFRLQEKLDADDTDLAGCRRQRRPPWPPSLLVAAAVALLHSRRVRPGRRHGGARHGKHCSTALSTFSPISADFLRTATRTSTKPIL